HQQGAHIPVGTGRRRLQLIIRHPRHDPVGVAQRPPIELQDVHCAHTLARTPTPLGAVPSSAACTATASIPRTTASMSSREKYRRSADITNSMAPGGSSTLK